MTADDRRDIVRYNLNAGHTNHHGVQRWSSWARHDADGDYRTNEYFYRAMSLAELDGYRNQFHFRQGLGHQGWAPFRNYSLQYLDFDDGITRLVEAHLPGFVQRMNAEGWFVGKIERGCMSWGIGIAQSNGWTRMPGRAARKSEAVEPIDIFHETLRTVRVVDLVCMP